MVIHENDCHFCQIRMIAQFSLQFFKRTFNENSFVGRRFVLFVNNDRRTDRQTYIVVNIPFLQLVYRS